MNLNNSFTKAFGDELHKKLLCTILPPSAAVLPCEIRIRKCTFTAILYSVQKLAFGIVLTLPTDNNTASAK